jgi:protein phosphatase
MTIVCPQCQSHNEAAEDFCVSCGCPLVTWWAIMQGSQGTPSLYSVAGQESLPTVTAPLFFDAEQRYRCLTSPIILPRLESSTSWEIQVPVLDCQPLASTTITQLCAETLPAKLPQAIRHLPAPAQACLVLRSRFYPTLPTIHAVWRQEQQVALLLENRSYFQSLADFCRQQPLPTLQVLEWLHVMLELWVALESWGYQQSLLEPKNLRVDEDGILCLQQLHANPIPLELPLLAQVWHQIFQQTLEPLGAGISDLIQQVLAGRLTELSDLTIALDAIAYEAQQDTLAPNLRQPTPLLTAPYFNLGSKSELPMEEELELSTENLTTNEFEPDQADTPTIVLPMKLTSLEAVGLTDVGKQRNHNEDFFGIQTQAVQTETPKGSTLQAKGVYVLCDGMGGHAGGEVASALAVQTLQDLFYAPWGTSLPDEATLSSAVIAANETIYAENQRRASLGSNRMGTTLVLMLLKDTDIAIAHVGDSRLYRLTRKRGLEQLTIDHEVGQREIQRGVDPDIAYARPDAYQLTQALGPRESQGIRPDIQFLSIREDSLLLLCSDGLTDNDLLESCWQSTLMPLLSSKANLDQGIHQLIELANQYNGHDNTSVIAVRVKVIPDMSGLPR